MPEILLGRACEHMREGPMMMERNIEDLLCSDKRCMAQTRPAHVKLSHNVYVPPAPYPSFAGMSSLRTCFVLKGSSPLFRNKLAGPSPLLRTKLASRRASFAASLCLHCCIPHPSAYPSSPGPCVWGAMHISA